MTIRNNLAVLMAQQNKFSIDEISKVTGLSRNTISSFKHNKAKGIQYETLESLCEYFNCEISDLLIHVKDAC